MLQCHAAQPKIGGAIPDVLFLECPRFISVLYSHPIESFAQSSLPITRLQHDDLLLK